MYPPDVEGRHAYYLLYTRIHVRQCDSEIIITTVPLPSYRHIKLLQPTRSFIHSFTNS